MAQGEREIIPAAIVSRRLITFILDPEKERENKLRLKEFKAQGKYKYTKEDWAATMREHRRYKQQLYRDGEIKESGDE